MQFLQPIGAEVYKFFSCKRKKVYVVKHYNELFDLKEPIVEQQMAEQPEHHAENPEQPAAERQLKKEPLPVIEESNEETKVVSMEDQAKQFLKDMHDDDMTYDTAELDHWVFTRKLDSEVKESVSEQKVPEPTLESTLIMPSAVPQ